MRQSESPGLDWVVSVAPSSTARCRVVDGDPFNLSSAQGCPKLLLGGNINELTGLATSEVGVGLPRQPGMPGFISVLIISVR